VSAVEWQAREVSRRTGLIINVAADDVPSDLSDDYKTCIYRIVQEALHNVAIHANAQTVRIAIDRTAEAIELAIQDDGAGFRPERERGLGLIGVQERVGNLGGVLRVESRLGEGTLLSVKLPLHATSEGDAR
jgi:signal transduction histidine kinase